MKFENQELEQIKERYTDPNLQLSKSVVKKNDEFEDLVIDCIENNGDPKIVLKAMLLQRERDQIMIS